MLDADHVGAEVGENSRAKRAREHARHVDNPYARKWRPGILFAFARRILTEAGVAVTPGKDFGHHEPERHIRIAYTQPVARHEEAVARLRQLLARR